MTSDTVFYLIHLTICEAKHFWHGMFSENELHGQLDLSYVITCEFSVIHVKRQDLWEFGRSVDICSF